jgi:enamine deaminase RidA (YjgF/YER057c/UK114 family)
MTRTNISTGGALEEKYGYSRAVRVGNVVKVSGTCAVDGDGNAVGAGDVAAQVARCFEIISSALEGAGATLGDIVINRVYLTNIQDAAAAGEAHGAIFGEVRPACTMMAVAGLVNPDFLVEIECEAVVPDDADMTTH